MVIAHDDAKRRSGGDTVATHYPQIMLKTSRPPIPCMHPDDWVFEWRRKLHRMVKHVRNELNNLPHECDSLGAAATACLTSLQELYAKLECFPIAASDGSLTGTEISQLLRLNRQLVEVTAHLKTVAADVTLPLRAKLADCNDPMSDFEIDVEIDYLLHNDDPQYALGTDRVFATRTEILNSGQQPDVTYWCDLEISGAALPEPCCWLFHDLCDLNFGRESNRLRDCLRVGAMLVEVQCSQQYQFLSQ